MAERKRRVDKSNPGHDIGVGCVPIVIGYSIAMVINPNPAACRLPCDPKTPPDYHELWEPS